MSRYLGILLVFWLSTAPLPAQETPSASPGPVPLHDYVVKIQGRQAYGVYFGHQKVGWFVTETRLGSHEGREVAIQNNEGQFVIQLHGEPFVSQMGATTTFELEGEGAILFSEKWTRENKTKTVYRAVREGDGLLVTTQTAGRSRERRVPLPRETLASNRRLYQWLTAPPRKGSTFETYSTSLDEDNLDTRAVYTYQGQRKIVWGGVPTDVYAVRINLQGGVFDAEVRADGTPITGRLGGALTLRAEEEVTARKLGGKGVDLLAASSIPVNRDLGDAARVVSLTLEVRGLGQFAVPESHRQRGRRRTGGAILLQLSRDHRLKQSAALSARARERYLEATPSLPAKDIPLRDLAQEVVQGEKDPVKVAGRLQRWVYQNLRKTMAANVSSALDVLANRAGDCTEHSLLFVALARAAGIPAREVGGLAFTSADRPLFAWHAWAEIHDGAQWVTVDPTWNQVYVDATHVTLDEGTEDFSWANLLGRLRFKVVQFRTRK